MLAININVDVQFNARDVFLGKSLLIDLFLHSYESDFIQELLTGMI